MKNFRLIILFCVSVFSATLFFSAFGISKAVYGDEQKFLRVVNEQTVFYSDESCTKELFCLPYTYYVKVLSEKNGICHVEFGNKNAPSIDGYVNKVLLFSDNLTVLEPYTNLALTTVRTAVLYADADGANAIQYVFENRQLYFYGKHINSFGKIVYYVSYNGNTGYIEEESIEPFSIPNHPNELTFIPKPPVVAPSLNQSQTADKSGDDLIIKVTVIGCLLLAGLIALFIALRPKTNKKPTASYYDENDYE